VGEEGWYFEHMEEGGFASVVEAEEEELRMFVEEAKWSKDIPEPTIDRLASRRENSKIGFVLYDEHGAGMDKGRDRALLTRQRRDISSRKNRSLGLGKIYGEQFRFQPKREAG